MPAGLVAGAETPGQAGAVHGGRRGTFRLLRVYTGLQEDAEGRGERECGGVPVAGRRAGRLPQRELYRQRSGGEDQMTSGL